MREPGVLAFRVTVPRPYEDQLLCSAQGRLVLSGLLEVEVPELRDAYGSLGPLEESRDGEWAALMIGPARA